MLVGMDAQHLLDGAAVAVHQGDAGDHLRDREPRTVAARLQAHEPVADAGERSEQHAVGDLDVADREGGSQGRLTHRFISQISRRPVSVRRSSISSIVSQ